MKTKSFQSIAEPIKNNPKRRDNIERQHDEALGEVIRYHLDELRKTRGITQVELARALGSNQPNVWRLEATTDPHLSTLRSYIEALGGRLEVAAVFDDERLVVAI